MQRPRPFLIDNRVIIEARTLYSKMPDNWSKSKRRVALADEYYVTGEGPDCIGVRNKENDWRFNVPKTCATNVSENA